MNEAHHVIITAEARWDYYLHPLARETVPNLANSSFKSFG